MAKRVKRSEHFFGDILPEKCFTEEAYEKRRNLSEKVSDIDEEIENILARYEAKTAGCCDCQWR